MTPTGVAGAALAVLMATVSALAMLIVIGRAVRRVRDRRRAKVAGPARRLLLAIAAGDAEPEQLDALVALPPRVWRAIEPNAVALLGKVRGEAHAALVTVFQRRGAADRAMADLGGRAASAAASTGHRRDGRRAGRIGAVRRARAAEILGNLERRDAVPALCMMLADPDAAVRVVVARALGRIADPLAAKPLLNTLASRRPIPSQLVAQALLRLGTGAQAAVIEALDSPDEAVRTTAAEVLGLIGAVSAASRVERVLRTDPSVEVRVRAARTLGRLGTRGAFAPLLEALEPDCPQALRAEAARALGELGMVAAAPALRRLLDDPQYGVAHHAAHSLVALGTAGEAALRAALEAPVPITAEGSHEVPPSRLAAEHAREALAIAAVEQQRLVTV